jgi:WD40 repeat protein
VATEFKYWAFISYSHADKQWGTWLHSALETFKVPKALIGATTRTGEPIPRRLFPIFRDREELPTSSDLGSMISRALEESRYLIVICSPRAARSRWVNQEILDFKRLGRADRILALIVDGEPNAADGKPGFSAEVECFPEALKYALGRDGNLDRNQPTEPIAADARPGMDGKTDAKLKLAAGILCINYDDLKRREERRRRRQHRIIISVSSALVLTFATLAAVALWQWRQAKIETNEANTQRQEAEKQKADAVAQRHVAETQKNIADEKTVEAENEKEQVETQTSADEEDIAREALLRGDPLTAAQHLSLAYEATPQDPAVRLLLHNAMNGLDGLSTVLAGNSGTFTNVAVSPVTGFVLTVSSDGEAQVWNAANGKVLATFGRSGNEYNQVHEAAFTPDGKRVLFANDSDACLEDIAAGKKIPFSAGQNQRFVSLVLSSDGKTVIGAVWTGVGDKFTTQIIAYSSSDGHEISHAAVPNSYAILDAPGSGARTVLIGGPISAGTQSAGRQVLVIESSTGKTVAQVLLATNDMALVSPQGELILVNHLSPTQPPDIYSAQTGAKVAELSTNGVTASRATWSPSGRYVLSAELVSGHANEALWDTSTWKPIHVWPNVVWSATTIDPTESLLASVTDPGGIAVWDLHSGNPLKSFNDSICAGNLLGAPTAMSSHIEFSSDNARLIDAGGGNCATIWNWRQVPSSQLVYSGNGATVNGVAFAPDGQQAVLAGNDGKTVVWNATTGAVEFTLQSKTAQPGAGVPMALFSPDGKEVMTGGSFQPAALWNAANGSPLGPLNFDTHAIVIGDTIRVGVGRPGNRGVTFSSDGWGALWDLAARKQLASLHTENGATVRSVSFAAGETEFVAADASGYAFVFDALGGTLKRRLGNQGTPLVAAEIAPQSDRVLTADANGRITIWRLADGRVIQSINGTVGAPAVNDVHFSPDGSTIIAACADDKVRTWNSQTGQPELTVAEETVPGELSFPVALRSDMANGTVVQAGMLRVLYSPDGSFFAGTNETAHILVWDAKTGKQLLRFEGHSGRVTSLAFSPDGTRLGSSSEDGTARIWDLGLESRTLAEIKQEIANTRAQSPR